MKVIESFTIDGEVVDDTGDVFLGHKVFERISNGETYLYFVGEHLEVMAQMSIDSFLNQSEPCPTDYFFNAKEGK